MEGDKTEAVDIRLEDRGAFLHAIVMGAEDSVDVTLDYWRRILEECADSGHSSILVEEDFPNQVSTTEIFLTMKEIAAMLPMGMRVAFVDRRSEQNDLNVFAETVAINRGAYGRVFESVESAEAWLRSH